MKENRSDTRYSAMRITLSAVLAALSLAFLYLAGFMPTGKIGLVALAGLFPAAAVISFGFSAGFLCYVGTGLLAGLFLADKVMVILYVGFFGLYPIIKGKVEQIRLLPVELLLKLVIFNLFLTLFLLMFGEVFFSLLPVGELSTKWSYLVFNLVFFAYDFGFSKVIGFYRQRVDRVLRNI